jgi:hypothetical protein
MGVNKATLPTRPSLREGCLALLGLCSSRRTRYAPCGRCAQTAARSQMLRRAARAAAKPCAAQLVRRGSRTPDSARCASAWWRACVRARLRYLSPNGWWCAGNGWYSRVGEHIPSVRADPSTSSGQGPLRGSKPLSTLRNLKPMRSEASTGNVCEANDRIALGPLLSRRAAQGFAGARASAHQHLTSGSCLNAASTARVVSSARPAKTEQRRAVGPRPTGDEGRLSFGSFSLAKQRKGTALSGAHPDAASRSEQDHQREAAQIEPSWIPASAGTTKHDTASRSESKPQRKAPPSRIPATRK